MLASFPVLGASASASLLSSAMVSVMAWLIVGLEVDRIAMRAARANSSNNSSRQTSSVSVDAPVGCRWAFVGLRVTGLGVFGGEGSCRLVTFVPVFVWIDIVLDKICMGSLICQVIRHILLDGLL